TTRAHFTITRTHDQHQHLDTTPLLQECRSALAVALERDASPWTSVPRLLLKASSSRNARWAAGGMGLAPRRRHARALLPHRAGGAELEGRPGPAYRRVRVGGPRLVTKWSQRETSSSSHAVAPSDSESRDSSR